MQDCADQQNQYRPCPTGVPRVPDRLRRLLDSINELEGPTRFAGGVFADHKVIGYRESMSSEKDLLIIF